MFRVQEIPEAENLSGEELYSLLFQEPGPSDLGWMDRPRPKKRAIEKKYQEYREWLKKEDGGQDEELEK